MNDKNFPAATLENYFVYDDAICFILCNIVEASFEL
uniref:Uncharacterized protein n=1 Tax=Rhizophora mucronata TaxID=61149 RepID=A0A2P2NLN3_RHIMU